MTRRVCSLLMIFCGLQASFLYAEEQIPDIQRLIQRIEAPITLVDRDTSQEIAVVAYLVLNNVPFRGLQDSRGAIEHLILLKNTLLNRPGMLERRLALKIQENIDCVLLAEANRRALSRNGKAVNPPYQEGSVRDDTVTSLLAHNAIAEVEHAEYLLQLSGAFSHYFHRKNFEVSDLLSGNAMKKLPSELQSLRIQLYGNTSGGRRMTREILDDFLVVYTLKVIDRARDIRMLWEVFRQEQDFYLIEGVEGHWKRIKKVLSSSSYRVNLITGRKKWASRFVYSGTECYDILHPDGRYASRLLFDFLPYFGDMWRITSQHDGIFSWFCQSENMELEELFRLERGGWLEFEE